MWGIHGNGNGEGWRVMGLLGGIWGHGAMGWDVGLWVWGYEIMVQCKFVWGHEVLCGVMGQHIGQETAMKLWSGMS